MKPIFHLSFPVRDLDEAIAFYVEALAATPGRRAESFADIFLFGAQITLQNDGQNVLRPMPRSRHFGATLDWPVWERIAQQFGGSNIVVEAPSHSHVGEPTEQIKFMIADPSGNLIELKAYIHPEDALGIPAEA